MDFSFQFLAAPLWNLPQAITSDVLYDAADIHKNPDTLYIHCLSEILRQKSSPLK